MRTNIPEKLIKIAEDIDEHGHVNLTRLTVLKKWFEQPARVAGFGIWIAQTNASRHGKTKGEALEFHRRAKALVMGKSLVHPEVDRVAATHLYHELREFQNVYRKVGWNTVREIEYAQLFLVEKGLGLYLFDRDSPALGYRLAAQYCEHYDPKYGTGLNGPSHAKIMEVVRVMFRVEALEDVPVGSSAPGHEPDAAE